MSDYQRSDGLTARTDMSTPCRCGRPDCDWTEADDVQRDRMESAQRITDAEDEARRWPMPAELATGWGSIDRSHLVWRGRS